MNNIYTLVLIILLICSGCISKKRMPENIASTEQTYTGSQATNFSGQSTWLLGYFTKERLTEPPHSEWYVKGYDKYRVDTNVVNKLTDVSRNSITIKIVMGTWCPDSRREVPRFMRILDYWEYPEDKITFIGVDDEKKSPVGEYENLDIERVPTFIFYINNVEAGRIIENPVTSLEMDMVKIIKRNE